MPLKVTGKVRNALEENLEMAAGILSLAVLGYVSKLQLSHVAVWHTLAFARRAH